MPDPFPTPLASVAAADPGPEHDDPPGPLMRAALALRYVMLAASLGALAGAGVMFWQGGAKVIGAGRGLLASEGAHAVIAAVMGATDAFLFGMVLMIFAYAIAFGFVFDLSESARQRLPAWMRVGSIGELKHTLIEVILVYLVVDFATDIAEHDADRSWQTLVVPASVLLIAAALRLLPAHSQHGSA